jgi:hypothetical protein
MVGAALAAVIPGALPAKELGRDLDPVVITGSELPGLLGVRRLVVVH